MTKKHHHQKKDFPSSSFATILSSFNITIHQLIHEISVFFALSLWIFGLLAVFASWIIALALLVLAPPIGAAMLSVLVLLLIAPLDIRPPSFARRFLSFSLHSAFEYFPVSVVYEDKDAVHAGRPYIIAFEPHSVLPQGMNAFGEYSPEELPPGLRHVRILVSSAGFWVPIMRQLWWWLGCRPASKSVAKVLLAKGRTVAICPGGVRECMYMRPDIEAVYLKKRHGFIRLAMETPGAAVLPVFAFGQSDMYRYVRPFFDWPRGIVPRGLWSRMARRIGFAPMLIWGWRGTPMPRRVPITIVVGKPLCFGDDGGEGDVERNLGVFIKEMERLYEKYRDVHEKRVDGSLNRRKDLVVY